MLKHIGTKRKDRAIDEIRELDQLYLRGNLKANSSIKTMRASRKCVNPTSEYVTFGVLVITLSNKENRHMERRMGTVKKRRIATKTSITDADLASVGFFKNNKRFFIFFKNKWHYYYSVSNAILSKRIFL